MTTAPSKQEGIAILSQYILTGMELCCRDFHCHAKLLHVEGGLYNFFPGDRFVNPGMNPAYPVGGFLMCKGLQGAEDDREAITASDVDMAELDGINSALDQIVRAAWVVLRVLVCPLTVHRKIGA